jgi:hypothetical protein
MKMGALFSFRRAGDVPAPVNKRDGTLYGFVPGFYEGPPEPWRWTPRVVGPDDYPIDADPSERITRPKKGIDVFPYPYLQITADLQTRMQGFMTPIIPLGDAAVLNAAYGRNFSGPIPWFNDYNRSFTAVTLPSTPKAQ